jgi:two-component system sensor histidine kinase/response regulator
MSNILLVDDRAENLRALEAVVEPLGHRTLQARSGEEALACLLKEDIALILLDVMMPGLDGFETAELIKQREKTREIPIIFLTAINQSIEHHLRGYETGAVDYISKPFDAHVLRSKVSVFLDLHEKRELLRRQAAELRLRLEERDSAQRALARRTVELTRSNTDLDEFVQVATHEMREPLDTMGGLLELVRARRSDSTDGELELLLDRAIAQVDRMRGAMDELLKSARLSDTLDAPEIVALDKVLEQAATDLETALTETGATIESAPLPSVRGDFWQLVELMELLIGYVLTLRGGDAPKVSVEATEGPDEHLVSVRHNGTEIPSEDSARLFTALGRVGAWDGRPGRDVGLAACRRIVERHGGRIWLEAATEADPSGVSFTLPAPAPR